MAGALRIDPAEASAPVKMRERTPVDVTSDPVEVIDPVSVGSGRTLPTLPLGTDVPANVRRASSRT